MTLEPQAGELREVKGKCGEEPSGSDGEQDGVKDLHRSYYSPPADNQLQQSGDYAKEKNPVKQYGIQGIKFRGEETSVPRLIFNEEESDENNDYYSHNLTYPLPWADNVPFCLFLPFSEQLVLVGRLSAHWTQQIYYHHGQ